MSKGISGTELVRCFAQKGQRIFTAEEAKALAPKAGLSPAYTTQALHYLVRSGWIIRLRRGTYALSPSMSGTAPLHDFEIGACLVRKAAISHWSAMSHHGLTEQIPRRVYITTTQTVTIPAVASSGEDTRRGRTGFTVRDTFFQFVKVKPQWFFGIENYWIGEAKVPITDPERTLLDGLKNPDYCGGWDEVFGAFKGYTSKLDVEKIADYALRLNATITKRLGWVLEALQVASPSVEKLRRFPIKGYRLLDVSGSQQGTYESKWMIRVNVPGRRS